LWILGLICFISLLFSVGQDFRRTSSANEEKIVLENPNVNGLEVSSLDYNKYNRNNSWFRLEPFATFDEDTAYIGNVSIRIEKSPTDSFQVGLIKMCNGNTRRDADTLASLINYTILQRDSLLMIDRALAINTTDKFRNQSVMVIIYVPVGRHIRINKNLDFNRNIRINGPWNDNDWYNWEDNDYYFQYGIEYIMQEGGLYTLTGIPAKDYERYRNNWRSQQDENRDYSTPDGDHYRYDQHDKVDSLRNSKEKEIQKIQKSVDSLKDAQEKQIIKMQDSLREAKDKLEQKIEKLNEKTAPASEAYIRTGGQGYNFVLHI
ncbi:MAG: hypothetical protein M3Z56_05110, partial [Bacteroidota bacterium]|nr:hypothetical protein [Bacteroidota bacterium]